MSEMKQGYHIRRNNPDVKPDENIRVKRTFPSGWIPFTLNLTIFVIVMLVGIFCGDGSLVKWYDIWTIGSVVMICYNGFWWMGRKEFLSNLRYSIHAIAKTIKLRNMIEKIDYKDILSEKNFNSHDEFKFYINDRLSFTKIPFYTSWIISLINLLTSIIVMIVFRYAL